MAALTTRNGCGVILAPFTTDEERPTWQGNYEFVEVEDNSRQTRRVEPALLKRYRNAHDQHVAQWKSSCTRHSVAFARECQMSHRWSRPYRRKGSVSERAVEPTL